MTFDKRSRAFAFDPALHDHWQPEPWRSGGFKPDAHCPGGRARVTLFAFRNDSPNFLSAISKSPTKKAFNRR